MAVSLDEVLESFDKVIQGKEHQLASAKVELNKARATYIDLTVKREALGSWSEDDEKTRLEALTKHSELEKQIVSLERELSLDFAL